MDANKYRNCIKKLIAWEWIILNNLERLKDELFY